MRFIHTADLHLDSPLRGLSAYPDAPVGRLRTATRDAFEQLVSRAVAERVDFMVIAGDVYDGDWKDFNTGLFFVRQMGRLRQAGIPVYLLYGNHDAESEMTRSLVLPDNVSVFSARQTDTFLLDAHRVALHGRSFKVAATLNSLLPSYPDPLPGWFNIGVMHTALEGQSAHARYAPCTVGELKARGYQYWALGHVHTPWVERGATTLAYPGNLQGRHIQEPGEHGALAVQVDDHDITAVELWPVDVLRWHTLTVPLQAETDRSGSLRAFRHALEDFLSTSRHDLPWALRVRFVGACAAHAVLAADPTQLRQELIAQVLTVAPDRVWIEKVVLDSAPLPEASPTAGWGGGELAAEWATLAAQVQASPTWAAGLQTQWQQVLDKLPHEVFKASPELQALRQDPGGQLPGRVQQALSLLSGRLADPTPSGD